MSQWKRVLKSCMVCHKHWKAVANALATSLGFEVVIVNLRAASSKESCLAKAAGRQWCHSENGP